MCGETVEGDPNIYVFIKKQQSKLLAELVIVGCASGHRYPIPDSDPDTWRIRKDVQGALLPLDRCIFFRSLYVNQQILLLIPNGKCKRLRHDMKMVHDII